MKINSKKYIIAKKGYPLEFVDDEGDLTDDITFAGKYYTRESAMYVLKEFDNPEEHEVILLSTTYEF